jgi:hypothetical protein
MAPHPSHVQTRCACANENACVFPRPLTRHSLPHAVIAASHLRDTRKAKSLGYCEISMLSRAALNKTLESFPESQKLVQEAALKLAFTRAILVISLYSQVKKARRESFTRSMGNLSSLGSSQVRNRMPCAHLYSTDHTLTCTDHTPTCTDHTPTCTDHTPTRAAPGHPLVAALSPAVGWSLLTVAATHAQANDPSRRKSSVAVESGPRPGALLRASSEWKHIRQKKQRASDILQRVNDLLELEMPWREAEAEKAATAKAAALAKVAHEAEMKDEDEARTRLRGGSYVEHA